ncbi:glycosyltransferase family 4 protein [Listeria booriae]|uniref:glycosyltransferase family 4 protein n=1 Tax=Listeria booriae TaxID=1552123 RepID=UPI0016280F3B|nr:glycosyltransferase family 4 protein [Listeria booriae]MBC1211351.1 glycosyltransferase family 4 protein [Listeria booriae]
MKQVTIMSSVHPWNDTRIFHREAVSLANAGYAVTLYAIESNRKYQNEITNLTVKTLPKKSKLKRFQTWFRLHHIARKSQASIVHLHDPELLPLGYFLQKFHKKQVVFDMHEDFPAVLQSKKIAKHAFAKPILRFVAYVEKKMLQKVSAVVFAEAYYKENYQDVLTKQVDIYNYPFLQEPMSVPKYEIPTLVYAGAIHEIRGFKEMLDVARLLKMAGHTFQILIIGQVPTRLETYASDFQRKHGLEQEIKLIGRVDLSQLMTYYAKSHIGLALLHPVGNYLRSLPTKIFEYMSFSLPYVLSDFEAYQELATSTSSGIAVDAEKPHEIAKQIQFLLKHPEEQKRLGENGYMYHQVKFNWATQEQRLSKLYQSILEEK